MAGQEQTRAQLQHQLGQAQSRAARLEAGNARLHDAYSQARRELDERRQAQRAEHEERVLAEALRNIAALLNSSLDLDEVLEGILTHVARVVLCQLGSILLIQGNAARVVRARSRGPSVLGFQLPLRSPVLRRAMDSGRPVIVDDTRTYDGWVSTPETAWIRSSLTAAIRAGDEVLGFLCLNSDEPSAFSPEHIDRLDAFANQAGVAVRNARLFAEIERQRQYSESLDVVARARELCEAGAQHVLVDMSGVPYMYSSGLVALHSVALLVRGQEPPSPEDGWAAFHAIHRDVDSGPQQLVKLLSPQPRVERTLNMAGFDRFFEVFADLEAAVASF